MDKIKNKILEMYIGIYFFITFIATNIFLVKILQHFNIELDFIVLLITIFSHAVMIDGKDLIFKKEDK